jgi:hypothetical protein
MTGSIPYDDAAVEAADPLQVPQLRKPPRVRRIALKARRRKRRWRRLSPFRRMVLVFGVFIIGVAALASVIHTLRAEPRDVRAIATRELTINTLAPGEELVHVVPVQLRRAVDYFRATRGLLVLTDRRLIFLGLRPRDFLSEMDAPPTFEERFFPIDTLVTVRPGRAMLGLMDGVVLRTPDGNLRLAVQASGVESAAQLTGAFQQRDSLVRERGAYQARLIQRAAAERAAAESTWRATQHYTVQRGDALGSIATRWNITQEQLRRWNNRSNNIVRVGETLVVRPADSDSSAAR